jgi:hypothetical protein
LSSDEANSARDGCRKNKQTKEKTMKTSQTAKALVLGGAVAGLLAGTNIRAHATPSASGSQFGAGQLADDSTPAKHGCKGQNSCKGQGGCKSSDNGCKGKNTCKGKGGCATDGSKG